MKPMMRLRRMRLEAINEEAMWLFDPLRPLMRVSLNIIRRSKAVNGILVFALTEAFATINWEAVVFALTEAVATINWEAVTTMNWL
jgi:hypothetical protein